MLLAFLLLLPSAVYAQEFMSVDEITPGMRGIAKTVVSGTQIEEFDIEVLGVMKNKGPSGDLILIKVSGDLIEQTGGIAQGMSGSPVYINGKLVGAIGFGFKMADHKVGMVTPIHDMLKIWEMPDKIYAGRFKSDDVSLEPVATPLMVSGFSERAMSRLADSLRPFNLVPYAVGNASENIAGGTLEPGSAIGVQLVRGDVSMGALGTVTYVDNGKILAFGHPFLKKGNVNFLMTNAYIYTTVNALESPFKIGTAGELVGTINQDRGAGVAGKLNTYPGIIPLTISVTDEDKPSCDTYAQIVQDEQLAPVLAENTVFSAVDKAIDRIGEGTARVSFEISGRGLSGDGVIKRDNMFYSSSNITAQVTQEFFDALALLADNHFNPVDIMDIKVNVDVNAQRKTAEIVEAQLLSPKAQPGDKVSINVKLKPYRGDVIERVVTYTVPKAQPAGPLTLEIRGGGTLPVLQQLLKEQGLVLKDFKKNNKNKSLDDAIKEFVGKSRNNDIVVEVFRDVPPMEMPAQVPAASTLNKEEQQIPANYTTVDYIIEGETQVLLNVVSGTDK